MAKGTWNEERVELLKELWGAGKTAAEIAQQLGENITRNAVIGKAHRLGLSGRVSPIQKKAKKAAKAPAAAKTPTAVASATAATAAPRQPRSVYVDTPKENGGVSLMELKDRMCHWPIGDPKKPGFHFCGDASVPGVPYCAEHTAVAYQGSVKKMAINAKDIDKLAGSGKNKSGDALDALDDALNT